MRSVEEVQNQIESAIVRINKEDGFGQGVLTYGGYILTAAHCIDYSLKGGMALNDYFWEKISSGGLELLASPVAVEPVSDIAVLNEPSWQGEEAINYLCWCEGIKPVPISFDHKDTETKLEVRIHTHKGKWIKGEATVYEKVLWVEFDQPIESGTSGGPVINMEGELVGIISNGTNNGWVPRPDFTLPVWLCERLSRLQGDSLK